MHSKLRYMYDEATAFRTIADMATAVSADADSETVALDRLVKHEGAYKDTLGAEEYTVVIVVDDAPTPNADETYVLNIKAADGTVVESVTVSGAGEYTRKLTDYQITAADADGNSLTIGVDVSGTAPALKYAAWLV
jgi:hypothetical protein